MEAALYDVFALYATDEVLENEGTWFPLGGEASIKLARSGNRKYAKLLTKLVQEHKAVLDREDDPVAEKLAVDITVDCLAQAVVMDWKGIGFKGKALPFSVENAKKLLAVKDFRLKVIGLCDQIDAYRAKEEKEQGEA